MANAPSIAHIGSSCAINTFKHRLHWMPEPTSGRNTKCPRIRSENKSLFLHYWPKITTHKCECEEWLFCIECFLIPAFCTCSFFGATRRLEPTNCRERFICSCVAITSEGVPDERTRNRINLSGSLWFNTWKIKIVRLLLIRFQHVIIWNSSFFSIFSLIYTHP